MGTVLCVITKSMSYRPHRMCSCYEHYARGLQRL